MVWRILVTAAAHSTQSPDWLHFLPNRESKEVYLSILLQRQCAPDYVPIRSDPNKHWASDSSFFRQRLPVIRHGVAGTQLVLLLCSLHCLAASGYVPEAYGYVYAPWVRHPLSRQREHPDWAGQIHWLRLASQADRIHSSHNWRTILSSYPCGKRCAVRKDVPGSLVPISRQRIVFQLSAITLFLVLVVAQLSSSVLKYPVLRWKSLRGKQEQLADHLYVLLCLPAQSLFPSSTVWKSSPSRWSSHFLNHLWKHHPAHKAVRQRLRLP